MIALTTSFHVPMCPDGLSRWRLDGELARLRWLPLFLPLPIAWLHYLLERRPPRPSRGDTRAGN